MQHQSRFDKLKSKIRREQAHVDAEEKGRELVCSEVPCGSSTVEVSTGPVTEEEFLVVAPVGKKRIIREPVERVVEITEPVSDEETQEQAKVITMPPKYREQ
ncbi:hypothetical protein P9112_013112 [Eukaryota sp. TZLM1-RC]